MCVCRGALPWGQIIPRAQAEAFWISEVSGAHSRTSPNARLSPPLEGPLTPTWAVVQTDVLEPRSQASGSLWGCWHGSFCPSAWQPETKGKGLAAQNETGPLPRRVLSARVEPSPLRGDHWESGPQGLARAGWGSTSVGSASRTRDMGCSVPLPVCWGLGVGSSAEGPMWGAPGRGEMMWNIWVMSGAPAPWAPCTPAEPRCLSKGLPPAAACGQDPGARGGDQAHHPQGQEPPPATVGAARLRVRPQHPGQRAEGARPALQQLQRAVPEHLRECSPMPAPAPTPARHSLLASVSSAGQDCPQHQQNCLAPLPPLLPTLPTQTNSPRLCLQV